VIAGGLFCVTLDPMWKLSLRLLALTGLSILLAASCGDKKSSSATEEVSAPGQDPALAEINRKIAADPDNISLYLDRAKYYSGKDNLTDAFRDIDRALAIDSTQAAIYIVKGELHWLLQDVRQAYDTYTRCLAVQPNDSPCLLKKAAIDIALRNYPVALEHINTALRQNELNPEPYYLKGRLYKESGDTTLSASSYQTAIELDPNYYDAYIEVGLLYHARKHDLASEYYTAAIEVRPKSIEAWYNKAMYLQETGMRDKKRFDEAKACYTAILEIDPNFAPAWFNQGYIDLEYTGNYKVAAESFTKAIQLNPSYYQAWYNRGLCHESLGLKKEAEADYRQALQVQPDYTEAAKALNRTLGER
jgi:tetratricopeptide (TPR) repeat protein